MDFRALLLSALARVLRCDASKGDLAYTRKVLYYVFGNDHPLGAPAQHAPVLTVTAVDTPGPPDENFERFINEVRRDC